MNTRRSTGINDTLLGDLNETKLWITLKIEINTRGLLKINQNRANSLVLRNVKKENTNENITLDVSLQNLSYVNYSF